MSSTSSSECECDHYWPGYETTYNNNYRHAYGRNPYYPVMGRPIVYYAQTPCQRNLLHGARERDRGNPNCFVKAFRWYTRDHTPKPSHPPMKPDLTGFAAWLDVKYEEYLQENLCGSEMYRVKLQQTFLAERFPATNTCEQCAGKIYSENNSNDCESCSQNRRPKKSRSTKKRRSKSDGASANREKSNQSCRYIMQPKEDSMSRPPSLTCHFSNTTTIISDCTKKPLGRSQSLSNVSLVIKEKAPCDVTPAQHESCDSKPKGDIRQNNTGQYVNSKQSSGKVNALAQNRLSQPAPSCIDIKVNVDIVQKNSCQSVNSKKSICEAEPSTHNRTATNQAAPSGSDTKTKDDTCTCENSKRNIQKHEASESVSCCGDAKIEAAVCEANTCEHVISIESISKVDVPIQNKANTSQTAPCDTKTSGVCPITCKSVSKQAVEEVSAPNKPTSQDFGCQYGGGIATTADAATQSDFAVPTNSRPVAQPSNDSGRLVKCDCELSDNIMQPRTRSGRSPHECACKSLDRMPQRPMSKMSTNSSKHSQRSGISQNNKNAECQYPAHKVVSIDAETQYVPQPMVCFENNLCECDYKGSVRCCQGPVQSVQMPSNPLPMCSSEGDTKEKIASVRFSQTTSQTSNHSIRLEEETAYPFFLKIVCADKLTNDNLK